MTEEVIVETPNDGIHIDTIEDQARDQGWVPKDEFQGEEHKWVEAGEFIRRGELFKKIEQVSKSAKRTEQTLEQFKSHYLKMQEIANKNAIDQLRKERKEARDSGDFDKVDELEEKMDEVKSNAETSKREILAATEVPEIYPEVSAWVDRNDWYNRDMPMKAYADTIAIQLNKQGISGNELLKGIDAEIRKAFPGKFSNPNRDRPGSVEGSTVPKGISRKDSFELSDQERRVMKNLVENKVLTEAEYITDLKKTKGIK